MPVDFVDLIETFYRFELPDHEWLVCLAERLQPLLDLSHLGMTGGFFDCPDPSSLHPTDIIVRGLSGGLEQAFWDGFPGLPPAFVSKIFLSNEAVRCSIAELPGWSEIPPVRDGSLAAAGALDAATITAVEADGNGCWFSSPQDRRGRFSGRSGIDLVRLARHFSAAYRLRHRLGGAAPRAETADAVLAPDGRVCYAMGAAVAAREDLTQAVRAREDLRPPGRRNPTTPLDDWSILGAAGWTLVDCFESDGKRMVLAFAGREQSSSITLLTVRERDVVWRAIEGSENKVIAYDLGIAESTVRVLMSRAAAKLGVHSRRELLAKLSTVPPLKKRLPP